VIVSLPEMKKSTDFQLVGFFVFSGCATFAQHQFYQFLE
jgi:hypothetical protein